MTTNSCHLKKFYNLAVTVLHVDIWRSLGNAEKEKHCSVGRVGWNWDSGATDRMT